MSDQEDQLSEDDPLPRDDEHEHSNDSSPPPRKHCVADFIVEDSEWEDEPDGDWEQQRTGVVPCNCQPTLVVSHATALWLVRTSDLNDWEVEQEQRAHDLAEKHSMKPKEVCHCILALSTYGVQHKLSTYNAKISQIMAELNARYKMRKHITKALQARSKAIKNAIECYNNTATLLHPPMPRLSWEQVVEYVFLANFDILRDTCAEVQSKLWMRPAYGLAMDRYFKILRAREEIKHLDIEIWRVITWIRDENMFLHRMDQNLRAANGKTAPIKPR
ncbi:hypothetical protein K438DRAFT_1960542 [Mycena galopus ATCC 62051]|nr:hypothetical protein K438DRAFT_1960542 [Mycena galopus ATCC 62051]